MKRLVFFGSITALVSMCLLQTKTIADETKSIGYPSTGVVFTDGDTTTYKIVVPTNADSTEIDAANEFSYFIAQSTGAKLDIVYERDISFSSNSKFIMLGNTSAASSNGITCSPKTSKTTGYKMKTVGNCLFIVGATPRGTLFGTYDLLHSMVNYRCYASDELYYDTNVAKLELPNFDISFVPAIANTQPYLFSICNDSCVAHRMYSVTQNETYVNIDGNFVHTCDKLLPYATYGVSHPNWYSNDGKQWCFSEALENDEMYSKIYENYKKALDANPTSLYASISQNDVNSWCECDRCKQSKAKYGSDLAILIKFVNKVAKQVKIDYPNRELFVHTFSYHKTSEAITYFDDSIKCEDNVSIMWAPIRGNYTTGFKDISNKSSYEALVALNKVCNHISAWTYDSHFPAFFITNNTFTGRQERYQTMSENGVDYIFDQSHGNTNQAMSILKGFLTSHMARDLSLNVNDMIKEFCDHYFKNASDSIQKYLDSYRTWTLYAYNVLGMHTDINGSNFMNSKFWPKGTLLEWVNIFEKAINDIEALKWTDKVIYEKVYTRICRESLTPRYLLISLYASSFSEIEADQMKRQFKKDCYSCGVTQVKEAVSIEELFVKWGI